VALENNWQIAGCIEGRATRLSNMAGFLATNARLSAWFDHLPNTGRPQTEGGVKPLPWGRSGAVRAKSTDGRLFRFGLLVPTQGRDALAAFVREANRR
jgi:hypothetical protein